MIREQPGLYFDLCVSRAEAHDWMATQELVVGDVGFTRASCIGRAQPWWSNSGYVGSTARHQDKEGQLTRGNSCHVTVIYGREHYESYDVRRRSCFDGRRNLLGRRLPTPTLRQILREMHRELARVNPLLSARR